MSEHPHDEASILPRRSPRAGGSYIRQPLRTLPGEGREQGGGLLHLPRRPLRSLACGEVRRLHGRQARRSAGVEVPRGCLRLLRVLPEGVGVQVALHARRLQLQERPPARAGRVELGGSAQALPEEEEADEPEEAEAAASEALTAAPPARMASAEEPHRLVRAAGYPRARFDSRRVHERGQVAVGARSQR